MVGKKKHFESTLPEGYREVFRLDASSPKIGIAMNLAALGILIPILVLAARVIQPTGFLANFRVFRQIWLVAAMFAYIVLHELVHGAVYKLLTGQKLTFGITLSVAYCGVPNIFVYRAPALMAVLAPFVVFCPVFLVPAFLCSNPWDKFYFMVLFAVHLSGCVGDLYDALLFLFRFRDPSILMRDTGPQQTFYQK